MSTTSYYKFGSVCAVYGCNNYKQQNQVKSFFRMPKNIQILKNWIVACKRKDLDDLLKTQKPEHFYKSYCVCSDHFEVACFRNKKLLSQGLFPGSVPTLKLYNVPDTLKRKSQDLVCPVPSVKKSKTESLVVNDVDNLSEDIPETTPPNEVPNDAIEALKEEIAHLKLSVKSCRKQLKNKVSLLSKFKKKNKRLQQQIIQLKKQTRRERFRSQKNFDKNL